MHTDGFIEVDQSPEYDVIEELRQSSRAAHVHGASSENGDRSNFEGERSNFEGDRSNFEGDRSNSRGDAEKNGRAPDPSIGLATKS